MNDLPIFDSVMASNISVISKSQIIKEFGDMLKLSADNGYSHIGFNYRHILKAAKTISRTKK